MDSSSRPSRRIGSVSLLTSAVATSSTQSAMPWSLVCVHLVNGSKDWIAVPNDDSLEVDFDWFCSDCRRKLPDVDVDDMWAICIHCVRELQAEVGIDLESFSGE